MVILMGKCIGIFAVVNARQVPTWATACIMSIKNAFTSEETKIQSDKIWVKTQFGAMLIWCRRFRKIKKETQSENASSGFRKTA
jgi:hypothetical protein